MHNFTITVTFTVHNSTVSKKTITAQCANMEQAQQIADERFVNTLEQIHLDGDVYEWDNDGIVAINTIHVNEDIYYAITVQKS